MGLLDGKVAIVTGAGGGLGAAYARLFAREGARLVVNDLGGSRDGSSSDQSAAQKVVDAINAEGGTAVANSDDVSTSDGGVRILQTALKAFARIDILVCNAGILRDKTFGNLSETDWDAVIRVHLKGAYCCSRPVWNWMRENKQPGVIVLTTSTSGLFGNFGQANYGAAKAGIYGLVRVLAIEGQRYGIRVMGLAPAALTRMTADLAWAESGPGSAPMSQPENIAPAVLYMVSDLAADHSGKVLWVSHAGVREVKMLHTSGFAPGRPYSAEELAANAEQIYFPG
ncbi:MAG: SDR family NAD(P)-dependent oxidoreductase [Steroidobacteraceae bacterium]